MDDLIILIVSIIALVLLNWPEKMENKNHKATSTE
jgi:hypothetical protein